MFVLLSHNCKETECWVRSAVLRRVAADVVSSFTFPCEVTCFWHIFDIPLKPIVTLIGLRRQRYLREHFINRRQNVFFKKVSQTNRVGRAHCSRDDSRNCTRVHLRDDGIYQQRKIWLCNFCRCAFE